jgi:hypothetical protein
MTEYVLTYGQPRRSTDGSGVLYEKRFLRVTRLDDSSAIHWAREVVPFEFGLTHTDKQYLGAPMVLWCVEPRGQTMVWESESGMALRVADLAAGCERGLLGVSLPLNNRTGFAC